MPGFRGELLLDWSAYARVLLARRGGDGRTLPERALTRFDGAVIAGELWVCPPFRLEALYSVTDARHHADLREELDALPQAAADAAAWRLAEQAQAELRAAPGVSHRVKLVDLLVGAIAHAAGLGILHYDHDYDVIARTTSLDFDSVWIATRGSVD